MSVKEILFTFRGRIPRRTYWLWSLVPGVIIVVLMGLLMPLFITPAPAGSPTAEPQISMVGNLVMLLLYLPLIWIGFAVGIKRWHDRGKSGAWILIALIPFVGGIWTFVECGCLRGTVGSNQYGPDPT
ncbi:MAG: DUF805 domain-containing protein [Verrucomicrobiaceae bacterium]|nr:MAG: DUF805 domain-containing protein [Verrucomicrobiaceae bacterium]